MWITMLVLWSAHITIEFLDKSFGTHHFAAIASASAVTSSKRVAMTFSFQQWQDNFQAHVLPQLNLQEKATVLESLAASCSSKEKELLFDVWRGCLCVDFVVALPPSLSSSVLSMLDLATLLCCTRVCRAWYNIVTEVKLAWTRHTSQLVWVPHPSGSAYQHFLRAGRHVRMIRDNAFKGVQIRVPSWVGGAGRDTCRHQLWGCGPDKVCIEWYRMDGWLKVQEGVQMCCIGEGGAVCLLWEATVGGELQGCLAVSERSVLMCGTWRSGLVWRSVSTGKVVRECSDVDLCPIRPTDLVTMCPTCCSVCVAMVREAIGEVEVIFLAFDISRSTVRFHCRLEGALLGAGLRGRDSDERPQCDVIMCQEDVEICNGHHMLFQTWSHQFALFDVTISEGGVGGALLPLCCLQLRPDLLGPLRGGWMKMCMSYTGQEVGLVACGCLVVLSVATLTRLHCVDVRECYRCLGSQMLQCVALGTAFAVLQGGETRDTEGGSKVCVVSLAGLLVCSYEACCAVVNAELLNWPVPHGSPPLPLCVYTALGQPPCA